MCIVNTLQTVAIIKAKQKKLSVRVDVRGGGLRLYCKTFIKLTTERPEIIVIYRKLDSTVPSLYGIYKSVTDCNYFQLEIQILFAVFKAKHYVIMQLPTVA